MTDDELKQKLNEAGADYVNISDVDVAKIAASEAAAKIATDAIKQRSFADRNSLPKMVNCHCGLRHRGPQCKQQFAKDKEGFERMCELNTRNGVNGAPIRQNFSMPRFNPHPSKRKLAVIRFVRRELPDEYTHEELVKVRNEAIRVVFKPYKQAVPTTPKKVKKDVKAV